MSRTTFDVASEIDRLPVSRYQRRALTVLGLCVVIDGFDVMAMAFVAPALVQAWGVSKGALGPVFAAGLAGMLVGSLLISWLADRVGRKPALFGSLVFFTVFTLCTILATDVAQLMVLRFVAGIGLGGVMPNATALASELSPLRKRSTLTMFVSSGFTLGAAVGGVLAALLVPRLGWQSIFLIGGVLPVLLLRPLVRMVPESLQWRIVRGRTASVARDMRRIDPATPACARSAYRKDADGARAGHLRAIFDGGRAVSTLLLWSINFLNLLVLYFLTNWIPTLAHDAGMSLTTAMLLGTVLLVGGLVGAVVLGPMIDRAGFARVLVPAAFAQAGLIAAIGATAHSIPWMFAAVAVAGFFIYGGQRGVIAFAGAIYPTPVRATGIGWSLGIGRVGSIIGPVLGGMLVQHQWSMTSLLLATAAPAALAAVLMALLAGAQYGLPAASAGHPDTRAAAG